MKAGLAGKWQEFKAEVHRTYHGFAEAHLFRTFGFLLTLIIIGATALWFIEGRNTFDNPFNALWWSLVTITTVGYGDISPSHLPGKFTTIVIILAGITHVNDLAPAAIETKMESFKNLKLKFVPGIIAPPA